MENDPTTSSDDIWLTVGISAFSAQNCPDGSTGFKLRLSVPATLVTTATQIINNVLVGGPVRTFEMMHVRTLTSGGDTWLGMRTQPLTAGTPLEPVVGPLAGSTGLAFGFYDANNLTTNVINNVRSVSLTVQPRSDGLVRTAGKAAKLDTITMTTRVALRNALRP